MRVRRENSEILGDINILRRKILVHSYIYYHHKPSASFERKIEDLIFELLDIQKKFPKLAEEGIYVEDFKNFKGVLSPNLPHDDWVKKNALLMLDYQKRGRL